MANLLSKINIGGVLYDIKDAYSRGQLEALSNELNIELEGVAEKVKAYVKHTGKFANDTEIKEYVDAQVGAIHNFDIVIGTGALNEVSGEYEPNVTASADTMYKLYLIANEDAASGEYIEWITIRSGEEGAYTYKWEAIGSTAMNLTGFVTEEALNGRLANYELKSNLKALAYKDSATGTVDGETIKGVKATGTTTGSIDVALEATEKDVASNGKYTPTGNVSGTVKPTGSVTVTVSNSAENATITRGDYTPTGDVAVALSGSEFNKITSVGTQASFEEGAFTPASLTKEDVTANYATEGIVGAVEGETLTFTTAGIAAITASKVSAFDGGSKAADTFVANSLPTMESHTVGVQSASFTGEVAENLAVTNVSYAKANADATATFVGDTNDISATFAGTEGDIAVTGKCHEYAVKTAEFNGASIELNVGDIVVSAKDVTVQ